MGVPAGEETETITIASSLYVNTGALIEIEVDAFVTVNGAERVG